MLTQTANGYNGNPNLPKGASKYQITPDMEKEFIKCMNDPVYFAETYFKIVHVDEGLIPFKLYDYQKKAIEASSKNRKFVMNASRQCGKCISINSTIKVRNKITGVIEKITVRDFIVKLLLNMGITDALTDEELIIAFTVFANGFAKQV